jgi:hypothetical protein
LWPLLSDTRSRNAVEVVERFADGLAGDDERAAASRLAHAAKDGLPSVIPVRYAAIAAYQSCFRRTDTGVSNVLWYAEASAADRAAERAAHAALSRDLFPGPCGPAPAVAPSVLTPTIVGLAKAASEHRSLPSGELDPERLGVLADALEEAGVVDAAILLHLRSPGGVHVRGCFAVDAVLGGIRVEGQK